MYRLVTFLSIHSRPPVPELSKAAIRPSNPNHFDPPPQGGVASGTIKAPRSGLCNIHIQRPKRWLSRGFQPQLPTKPNTPQHAVGEATHTDHNRLPRKRASSYACWAPSHQTRSKELTPTALE